MLDKVILFGVLSCFVVGCHEKDGGAIDAGPADDMTVDVSMHPALPIVSSAGGPVISAMEHWTVVWQGDEARGMEAQQFVAWLLDDDYWKVNLAEYGVGAGTTKGVIVIPSAPPATIEELAIDDIVDQAVTLSGLTVTSQTAFSVIIPTTTVPTEQGQPAGCSQSTSYHSETLSSHLPYAVILNCTVRTMQHELTHELGEVATDPYYRSSPAYTNLDFGAEGEIADFCAYAQENVVSAPVDGGTGSYTIPRFYSNKVALAGTSDPCVPAPAQPYFNVASDPVIVPLAADAQGLHGTMTLDAFAFGSVGTLSWRSRTLIDGVTFTPASGMLAPGETTTVTVTAGETVTRGTVFYLESTDSNGHTNVWTSAFSF